jgi:hypothetical protein
MDCNRDRILGRVISLSRLAGASITHRGHASPLWGIACLRPFRSLAMQTITRTTSSNSTPSIRRLSDKWVFWVTTAAFMGSLLISWLQG